MDNTTSFTKWKTIFDDILKLTDKSTKDVIQEILKKFMDPTCNTVEYGKISQFCDIIISKALSSIAKQDLLAAFAKTENFLNICRKNCSLN